MTQIINSWRKDMYFARIIQDGLVNENGRLQFAEPIKLSGINYKPVSSRTDIEIYGISAKDMQKAVLIKGQPNYELFVKDADEGSLVYLDGASPLIKPVWDKFTEGDVEEIHGQWANYVIDSIQIYGITKHVYFTRYKSSGV